MKKTTHAASTEKPELALLPNAVPASPERSELPVVGLGASAGGLLAFEQFFSAMPDSVGSGLAFVLVQHLNPEHPSILGEIIQKYTSLDVCEATDGMPILPGRIHVIPPNHDMALVNGTLQLLDVPKARRDRRPIDFFFRSLALDRQDRAICIVLSGTGSDGTEGLRAVKAEGGMGLVQAPESAEFDGMPRSAIATRLADCVIAPCEMPAKIHAYVTQAFRLGPDESKEFEKSLKKICYLVHSHTGHDFSLYKKASLMRRIERRMACQQIAKMENYVRYLQENPDEVNLLFKDLLISVSRFFRDPEAFAELEKTVISKLFTSRAKEGPIRVWVPGCATGEEAYSIAILLKEKAEELKKDVLAQVFATDIDLAAIEHARAGVYPATVSNDISSDRLARFFTRESDGVSLRINKNIRDLLIFSAQDVIKDPPFSKLDLISCRNLLIYMEPALQKRVLPLFHFALNPGGILFLGTSETVGDSCPHFSTLDRKAKIYQRADNGGAIRRPVFEHILASLPTGKTSPHPLTSRKGGKERLAGRELTERALLLAFPLCALLVTARGDIIYLHGRSGHYLEPSPGNAGMNVLTMARTGLRRDLSIALHKAVSGKAPVSINGLRVKTNGDFSTVNLTVRPLDKELAGEEPLFLVILEERSAHEEVKPAESPKKKSRSGSTELIEALQAELRAKEEFLQSSNEELKAANEEMQSTNEEMQSTNEELETSKEEMQSLNEELITLNAELQTKVLDLSKSNNDMSNLMAATGIGMIFVDHDQRIQRFTPPATQIINLIPSDIGRPVGHLVSNLDGYPSLVQDIQEVLDTLVPKEIEVRTASNVWFLLGIRPYRTLENVIEGAVITFTEIDTIKEARASIKESAALHQIAGIVNSARDAIIVRDMQCRILAWNPAATKLYGWNEKEALAMSLLALIPEELRHAELTSIQEIAASGKLEPYEARRLTKDGRTIEVLITATLLDDPTGKPCAISTTERPKPT